MLWKNKGMNEEVVVECERSGLSCRSPGPGGVYVTITLEPKHSDIQV